ncbi:spore germination protein [Gorillibacterium timonense]|uniref:spore germination protein n=1 Tax=Gorillibacterium timonense TaxID=1689269 RepID=UPI00071C2D72|nr:spore germination protein [Gorillibacterium timonense]
MDTSELSNDISVSVQTLEALFTGSSDIVFHRLLIENSLEAELIYVENMCDMQRVERGVLIPLQKITRDHALSPGHLEKVLPIGKVQIITKRDEAVHHILSGNPVLLVDKLPHAFALGLATWNQRSIEQPSGENVVRGPHESFNETMATNLSILRRRLRTPDLKTKTVSTGLISDTPLTVAYLQNMASPELLDEVMRRLEAVRRDSILESGMLEELIQDNPYSPFPQLLSTERPDVVTSQLLEGRVAIFTEGTPFVLIAPGNFFSFIQSPEDYDNAWKGSITRLLRYLYLIIALLLPAAYVAIVTYHQEMIPTNLLLTIANTREQVPFPVLVETLLMELMFEALREAGLRLPKQIGSAVSIVGALVIGQAAISAGLVSPPMVMVVAITGIASFMVPHYAISIPLRMLRFPIMIISGMLGLVGFVLSFVTVIIHMAGLTSFGVPYFSLQRASEVKDTLIRAPFRQLENRPFMSSYSENIPGYPQGPSSKGNSGSGGKES